MIAEALERPQTSRVPHRPTFANEAFPVARAALAGQSMAMPPKRLGLAFGWIGSSALEAERQGINVRRQLIQTGVASHIEDDTSLDPAAFLLMCGVIINAVDDEMHGMARSRMARGTAAMACQAMTAERTLEGAINFAARFFRMVGSFCRLELHSYGENASLRITSDAAEGKMGFVVEEMMAHFLHLQFSFLVQSFLPLTGFVTRGAQHPAIGQTHPYLLCPVQFGSITEIRFPAYLLAMPCIGRVDDMPLWDAQRFWLLHHPQMRMMRTTRIYARGLASALFEMLQSGVSSIEECGDAMKMTVPQLRRGLYEEGLTFRQVKRDALVAQARPHLEAGMSADDVAELLGYSDSRSFRRALKLAGAGTIRTLRAAPNAEEGTTLDARIFKALRHQCAIMQ